MNNSSRWHTSSCLNTQTQLIRSDAETAAILEQLKANEGRITRSNSRQIQYLELTLQLKMLILAVELW